MPIDSETPNKEARAFKAKPDLSSRDEGVIRVNWDEELAKAKEEGRVKDAEEIEKALEKINNMRATKEKRPSGLSENEESSLLDLEKSPPNLPSLENQARVFRPLKKSEIFIDKIKKFFGFR